MEFKLFIFPEAQEDIEYASFWYELNKNELGSEFILALDAELNQIRNNPHIHNKIYKEFIRAIIDRFPYAIFYIIDDYRINILAIIHLSRNPKIWKKRNK